MDTGRERANLHAASKLHSELPVQFRVQADSSLKGLTEGFRKLGFVKDPDVENHYLLNIRMAFDTAVSHARNLREMQGVWHVTIDFVKESGEARQEEPEGGV